MLRVMNCSERSNRIQIACPHSRNRKYGVVPGGSTARTPPKMIEVRPMGAVTRTIIQIQPSELRVYIDCSARVEKYPSKWRYCQTSAILAKTLSCRGSIVHSPTTDSGA